MTVHANGIIVTGPGKIVWDGITNPEKKTNDKTKEEYTQSTLSIAIPATDPSHLELDTALRNELASGEFKGVFPNGAHWGIKQIEAGKYEDRLVGHVIVKGVSYQSVSVYSADNKILDPTMYQKLLYPGAIVEMILTARSYNNVSKGLGFWLQGVRIVDATAPRLPVDGVDAGALFAATPLPAGTPVMPVAPGAVAPPVMPIAPGAVAPPVMPVAPGAVAPPVMPVTPAPEYIAAPPPPVHQMTALAKGATYEAMIAAGWTDITLVQHGMMLP